MMDETRKDKAPSSSDNEKQQQAEALEKHQTALSRHLQRVKASKEDAAIYRDCSRGPGDSRE